MNDNTKQDPDSLPHSSGMPFHFANASELIEEVKLILAFSRSNLDHKTI